MTIRGTSVIREGGKEFGGLKPGAGWGLPGYYAHAGEDRTGFGGLEPGGRQGTAALRTIEDDRATYGRGLPGY